MRIIIIFLILSSFFDVNGQNEFRLERVKTIPENATVNDILVHSGNISIATNVGLYQINSENLETRLISKKNINAVCSAAGNQIWAAIDNRFLQNMTSGETTNLNTTSLDIRDLEYSKGKVWVATNQGIITVITRTNELGKIEFSKRSGLPSNNVAFIHIDKQKQMWIGTDQGIVFINKKDKWKTYEKKLSMEAMHYNHEGLWLVSNEEMWVVDDFNRWYPAAIDKGLRKGKIRDITADSTGRLYMASEILVRYDPYDETIESYADNTAIVSKVCTSVESDRDNRIWLGTKGGGLFLFGYADQATTVEELILARDKRIQEANRNGAPIVEERLIDTERDSGIASTSNNVVLAAESTTSGVESVSGQGHTVQGKEASSVDEEVMINNSEMNTKEKALKKLQIVHTVNQPIKCAEGLATISLTINGGKAPYKVIWDHDKGEQLQKSLTAGNYKVFVTDDMGQTISSNVILEGKIPLEIKIINKRSPTALGRKDGNVKIAVSGGTAPYSIDWSNGETGDRARRLENGVHEITVIDVNGCTTKKKIEVKAKIMEDLDIQKVTVGQKLEIKNIYYEADSTEVTVDSYDSLEELYQFLSDNEKVRIEIGGHTNNLPPDEYCDRISTARAKSVADYLYNKGISEERITYKGYGKRNPIASNATKEGRRRNQRVEIEIISK